MAGVSKKVSGFLTNLPILAAKLVAVAGGFSETINAALLNLPFAIEGGQSMLEALGAETMRVSFNFRGSASPYFIASYALEHHKPFRGAGLFAK